MKVMLTRFFVFFTIFLSASSFSADNVESFSSGDPIRVEDGDTFRIKLSTRDLNRISVKGGRISKIWARDGFLVIQKAQGEALILPASTSPAVFSFFVRDEYGSTYTLVAERFDIPAQSIVLDPAKKFPDKQVSGVFDKANSDPIRIKSNKLIKAMALDNDLKGYSKALYNAVVPLWKETRITLVRAYEGRDFRGDVYLIENISDDSLTFNETEFQDFGDHVFGVALGKLDVAPKETTTLFIVRRLPEVKHGR